MVIIQVFWFLLSSSQKEELAKRDAAVKAAQLVEEVAQLEKEVMCTQDMESIRQIVVGFHSLVVLMSFSPSFSCGLAARMCPHRPRSNQLP